MDFLLRSRNVINKDISRGAEIAPIPVINDINNARPESFCYMVKNKFTAKMMPLVEKEKTGCTCEGECNPETCECEIASSVVFNPKERLVIVPHAYHMNKHKYVDCGQHCDCRAKCKRRLINGHVAKRMFLEYVDGKGFGLIAAQPIALGMPIFEYIGEVLHSSERNSRGDYQYTAFLYNGNQECINIDSHDFGNISRFANHSCLPNMVGIRVYSSIPSEEIYPPPRIVLIAIRNIHPGEELTFDYGVNYFYDRKIPCRCYSPICYVPPKDYYHKTKTREETWDEIPDRESYIRKNWRLTKDIEPEVVDLDSD